MPLFGGGRRGLGQFARRFWRTSIAALLVGGVCTWQTVFSGTPDAAADQSSQSSWVPGNATASSQAFSVGPTQAGLSYAFTFGFTVADFQGSEGYAESKTFDGGALVTSAEVQECPGSSPDLAASPANQPNDLQDKDYLPNPVVAEAPTSSGGNDANTTTLTSEYAQSTNLPGASAGLEQASATTQPSGTSVAKITEFGIPGVFDISGAQSSSSAQQVPGQLREAVSTSDIAEVSLAGIVDLKDLHWQDTQETGPGGAIVEQSSSFSLGQLSVAGTNIPVASDSAAQLTDIMNTALSGEGMHVTIPVPATDSNGEQDIGSVSVGIDNSNLLAQALGPAWTTVDDGTGPLKGYGPTVNDLEQDQNPYTGQPLVHTGVPTTDQQVASVLCQLNTPTAAASILAAVLVGGGTLDLDLGGDSALSLGTAYANPFGSQSGSPDLSGVGAGSATSPDLGGFTPGTSGTPGTPGTPGTAGAGGAVPAKLALGRTSERCVASCGSDGAMTVGLIGLGAIAAVGVADFVRARRMRRLAPVPVEVTGE